MSSVTHLAVLRDPDTRAQYDSLYVVVNGQLWFAIIHDGDTGADVVSPTWVRVLLPNEQPPEAGDATR